MHGIRRPQKKLRRQLFVTLPGCGQNHRGQRQPFPKTLVQIGRELPHDHAVLAGIEAPFPQMAVKHGRQLDLSDLATSDATRCPRMLPDLVAPRFAQVALGEIRCVVIGQRRSSSSNRAESTVIRGKRSKPRTSLRLEKSTPAFSSTGTKRAAGRPRSRTSTPRRPRAAARTHFPVFMCNSRIVMGAICAQCDTKWRLSTPPLGSQGKARAGGGGGARASERSDRAG